MCTEPDHLVFDDSRSEVSLSYHTKVVCDMPDSFPVIGLGDRAIREVDDLIAILQVDDDLGAPRDDSLDL